MEARDDRNAKGQFKPGISGNPKGRTPKSEEQISVEEAAKVYTQEALDILVKHMRGDDARVSVQAANAILDRGNGKPMQNLTGRIEHTDMTGAHLEALRAIVQRQRGPITDVDTDPPLIEAQPVN